MIFVIGKRETLFICAQTAGYSFVCLPLNVLSILAGASFSHLSRSGRLCAVGHRLKANLVYLLLMGKNHHVEQGKACHQMMQSIARRVAAGLATAERDKAAKEAVELCASGQCGAALVPLQCAMDLGDCTSRALKAWLLIDGREGVAQDDKRSFELAEEGVRLGCHHCQGVLALCYLLGKGCRRNSLRSLELARKSSGSGLGSRYGQHTLGELHRRGLGELGVDEAQAVAFFRLATAQSLDGAQWRLGLMYDYGLGVAQDSAEALRLYHLAAAQGHPTALYSVARCHDNGTGVRKNVAEAICWYRRAQAAGDTFTEYPLKRLGAE